MAGGVFAQSKWGLAERALQEVDVLCLLGHGASGAPSSSPPALGEGYLPVSAAGMGAELGSDLEVGPLS